MCECVKIYTIRAILRRSGAHIPYYKEIRYEKCRCSSHWGERCWICGCADRKNPEAVVIGGGLLGVEIFDELNKQGKGVTVVEILPHVLGAVFDEDLAIKAEDILMERGVKVEDGAGVKGICGNGKVESVKLQDGKELQAEAVILAMGYRPNIELAQKAGIETNELGFLRADDANWDPPAAHCPSHSISFDQGGRDSSQKDPLPCLGRMVDLIEKLPQGRSFLFTKMSTERISGILI